MSVLLQACDVSKWVAGDWHNCIFDPVTGLIGVGVFGLLIASGVWISFYYAGGGSTTTPTAVMILLATFAFGALPGAYSGIAWSMLLVGAAAAIFQSLQKYVLSPSTQ